MTAKKAMRKVAKLNGISEQELRDEIRYAISLAWLNGTKEEAEHQRKIPCGGEQPTPEELIEYIAVKLRE